MHRTYIAKLQHRRHHVCHIDRQRVTVGFAHCGTRVKVSSVVFRQAISTLVFSACGFVVHPLIKYSHCRDGPFIHGVEWSSLVFARGIVARSMLMARPETHQEVEPSRGICQH